jgi:hypothetical protein
MPQLVVGDSRLISGVLVCGIGWVAIIGMRTAETTRIRNNARLSFIFYLP